MLMNEFELFSFRISSSFIPNRCLFFFLLVVIFFLLILIYCVLKKKNNNVLFFGSSDSSSVISSGTPCSSSSSSGGKDPKKSFWEKYWKIIFCSLVSITVFSSVVLYLYYSYSITETVNLEELTKSTLEGINTAPGFYYDFNRTVVSPNMVVLNNPMGSQYAPFCPYWEDILRRRLSAQDFDFFCARYNLPTEGHRMVFSDYFMFNFLFSYLSNKM